MVWTVEFAMVSSRFQFTNGVDLGATKARSGSPLAETMLQIYKNDVGYVLWNDQPLSKGKARIPKLHAHAKGLCMQWQCLACALRLSCHCNKRQAAHSVLITEAWVNSLVQNIRVLPRYR